jgi:RND family efflux transporter MFP subunit
MNDRDQSNPRTVESHQTPPKLRPRARRRWGGRPFALSGLLLLTVGIALGASRHSSQRHRVMATVEETRQFELTLGVAVVQASPAVTSVTLPGTTAAFAEASVYARATGYIAKRKVDIGDHVKNGGLLAELAVPEIDDQIAQNEATLERLEAAVQQAQANVAAQERLLTVLRQNRDYASVVAPFDGVITQRNVDVGSLVQGDANTGNFMFEMMQKDVIRVWVYVPQDAAFGVAPGVDVIVRVPELPDRAFSGKLTRISEALQSGTRTLLTEIDISNPDGALPGSYCSFELKIPRKPPSFIAPGEALIFNRNGLQVAVVKDSKAKIRENRVKRDLGTQVEVDTGLKGDEQVVLNPPATRVDGDKVQTSTRRRVGRMS